jgi:glutamate dehydrogenase/leucine dehydrogenase
MKDQSIIIELDENSAQDKEFFIETFGLDAFKQKWARAGNRFLFFKGSLSNEQIDEIKSKPKLPSILERPAKKLIGGDAKRQLLKMEDGTNVTWIRHPSALPEVCRPFWRDHTHLFVLENESLDFTAYTSIFSYGSLEGADGKYRIFGPGGIRWIDYPDHESAICDALDMSLAVAMKIEVVKTPCAGNKIAVIGDYSKRGPALNSLFKAYERMGLVMTSADLGLTVEEDLKENALPVAPRCLIPLGVYQKGVPTSIVAADGSFAGVLAMAKVLGQPLSELSISVQGIGEVGERASAHMLEKGANLIITEADSETRQAFEEKHKEYMTAGKLKFLDDLDAIYDAKVDIFYPCALRDILTEHNLERLKKAGVKMVGGPANNLFPDQINGPWIYHEQGLPVVPYEGIGAGGVCGVAFSVMTGVYGSCPFTIEEKIKKIHDYVIKIMTWSSKYDLPPQVISDCILFSSTKRRRIMTQEKADYIVGKLADAFAQDDAAFEEDTVNYWTKNGFFKGAGSFRK